MSAAPANAPSHPPAAPTAAPSAAPAAANSTMHFNHGGVLGLTESIAKLVKGVTYDAAMDTFAHPANNPNMGAAHPTDDSHPAPHPAPHPTPAADGAHPAPHPAPHPTDGSHPAPHPAPAAGHDDDDDDSISGSIIKGLSHMGHYGMAFPVLAQGLKWAKNKMFPEIHEIPTEDQHVGDQILHKLKKNKKNKTELDHHALEGFLKGMDVANIQRTFRMFMDEGRFKTASKPENESGREEIKKEIANLFDISGDVDKAEATQITKLLKDLLHIHGHLHHGEWVIDTTHVDSRVRTQFTVLAKVILNAEKWLGEDGVLEKIYTGKSEKFEIDYDHFGDVLFEKVNKDNRKGFLKAFNKRSFDNAFGLLVKESEMKEAIKHDPDHLKDQIYKLFDCAGKVGGKDLKNRFEDYFGKEATPATPAIEGILGKESDYDDAGQKKYKEFKTAIENIMGNITSTGALEALFHSVTPVNLGEFGKSLDKVKDKEELTKFLKGFDIHRFKKNFRFILDGGRLDKIVQGDEVQRRGAQTQLLALLGYDNGPLDEAEMTAVIGGFRSTLSTLAPTIDASLKGTDKPYDQLLAVLTEIEAVLKDKDRVRKVFEGAELEATPNHNAIGKQILEEIGEDKKKQIPFLKNLNVAVYTAKVSILTSDGLDMLIDSPPEIPKIKEAITNLFGIEGTGPVHPHDIAAGIEAMKAALQNPKLAYDPEAKASYDAFEALLKKVNKNLTGPRLKKIYS